ncbi:hypothetical protein H5410_063105, partial [Solanum commersonii]
GAAGYSPGTTAKAILFDKYNDKSLEKTQGHPLWWKVSRKKVCLQHRPYDLVDGKPVVRFTEEEHAMLAETCRWIVIVKFPRRKNLLDFRRTISLCSDRGLGSQSLLD